MTYWKTYNQKLISFAKDMAHHNNGSDFNYVEDQFYPHVRDLLALCLSMMDAQSIKILDYGSNLVTWANMKNKIDCSALDVTVYDPFWFHHNEADLDLPFKQIKIVNDLAPIKEQSFQLCVFGSVAQYDVNFFENWEHQRNFDSDYILFTHTPLSLGDSFVSKQHSDYQGDQHVHAYHTLKETVEQNGYDLIFKSILDHQYASVEPRYLDQTIYANLLFKKR